MKNYDRTKLSASDQKTFDKILEFIDLIGLKINNLPLGKDTYKNASYDPENNTLTIRYPYDYFEEAIILNNKNGTSLKSMDIFINALLHEVSHYISDLRITKKNDKEVKTTAEFEALPFFGSL